MDPQASTLADTSTRVILHKHYLCLVNPTDFLDLASGYVTMQLMC